MIIEKFKVRLKNGKIVTHPAFIEDGKEIDGIEISDPIEFDSRQQIY